VRLAFVLALGVGVPAGAQDALLDAATLRARIAAAEGPVPANFRETIAGPTTRTTYHRGTDVRTVFQRGPIHTEAGSYHGERWIQDANGLTAVDEPAPAPPLPPAPTVKRVAQPFDAYVIESLDAAGYGTREFVDPATSRVLRVEQIAPIGTTVIAFEEFAAFGSRKLPARWSVTDPLTRATYAVRRTEYSEGTVLDSDVAEPPIRRTLVEFPPGVRSVRLPTRFDRDFVLVTVKIARADLDFALDTGESGIAIDEAVARSAGLQLVNPTERRGAGAFTQYDTVAPLMEIGPLTMRNIVMRTIQPSTPHPGQLRIAGTLGFDFLAELGVTIDYVRHSVVVAPALAWTPPQGPNVLALNVRLATGTPRVSVSLDGQSGDRFIIDTGTNASLLVTDAFVRAHKDLFAGSGKRQSYFGVAGSFDVEQYMMREVVFSQVHFHGIPVLRATSPAYGAVDGVIGTRLLHYFTLDVHYADGRMYLTRNNLQPGQLDY